MSVGTFTTRYKVTRLPRTSWIIVWILIAFIHFCRSWQQLYFIFFFISCIYQCVFMVFRKESCVIFDTMYFLPYNLCHKITFTEYLITKNSHISLLAIIDTNKYHPILAQQILSHLQTWVYHVEPVGMKTPVTFRVGNKAITLFILLTAIVHILTSRL